MKTQVQHEEEFTALELQTFIERCNNGQLRRYHFTNGTTLVICTKKRSARMIPQSCRHILCKCDRKTAARALITGRRNRIARLH
jgi:hypothetical protein